MNYSKQINYIVDNFKDINVINIMANNNVEVTGYEYDNTFNSVRIKTETPDEANEIRDIIKMEQIIKEIDEGK